VCGRIHSGSSALFKFLANALHTSRTQRKSAPWTFVELDSSGTDFALPGHISISTLRIPLLGPGFANTAALEIEKQHFVGVDGVKALDERYLNCVLNLVHKPNQKGPINMIVHAPECYQTSSLGLTRQLMQVVGTSEAIVLGSEADDHVKQLLKGHSGSALLAEIQDDQLFSWPRTKAQLRDMAMMSFFHQLPKHRLDITPISSWRPLCVSYAAGISDVFGVLILGDVSMFENMVATLMNGMIASVFVPSKPDVTIPESTTFGQGDRIPYFEASSAEGRIILDPTMWKTVGFVLVRAVDIQNQRLLVAAPGLFKEHLANQDIVLCVGGFEAPGWAFMEDSCYQESSRRGGDTLTKLLLVEGEEYPYLSIN
jgi:hypothetical protein